MMYYVYALVCPINNYPFYIGKGKGGRLTQHFNKSELWNKQKRSYIKGLELLGLKAIPKILFTFENELEAFDVEYHLLNSGIPGLTNVRRCLDKPGGRPGKVNVDPEIIRKLYIDEGKTKDQVCKLLSIGKATINRILDENDIIKLYTRKCKANRMSN